jgi:hypothetical protein
MKKNLVTRSGGAILILMICTPLFCFGQSEKAFIGKYLKELPRVFEKKSNELLKYRMTAVYTNLDIYGNFTSKTKVTGDYTRGLPGDSVAWNNIYISGSQKFEEPFPAGSKQEYMENFRYIPSSKMVLDPQAFKNFPSSIENIFSKNLVWDMYSFEIFAWVYYDSLKMNTPYIIPDIKGQFDMSNIGKYTHNKILLTWKGITDVNNELCAIIDFTAINNKLEINMEQIKSKGTEQYWGTVMVSLKTRNIEQGVMYGGTIQEIEIAGMKDKLLMKTIRELSVDRIQ